MSSPINTKTALNTVTIENGWYIWCIPRLSTGIIHNNNVLTIEWIISQILSTCMLHDWFYYLLMFSNPGQIDIKNGCNLSKLKRKTAAATHPCQHMFEPSDNLSTRHTLTMNRHTDKEMMSDIDRMHSSDCISNKFLPQEISLQKYLTASFFTLVFFFCNFHFSLKKTSDAFPFLSVSFMNWWINFISCPNGLENEQLKLSFS